VPVWYQKKHSPTHTYIIINHPLSASSIYYNLQHPPCSIYVLDSLLHKLSPSPLWCTSGFGTLHFILHTFPHSIGVFFLQHMPIPLKPVLCSTEIMSSNPSLSQLFTWNSIFFLKGHLTILISAH